MNGITKAQQRLGVFFEGLLEDPQKWFASHLFTDTEMFYIMFCIHIVTMSGN